ncbi:hypothetical protein FPSE_06990 [Fusarium pseudograminearum CS3096]|uniref:C2H2-type domain-containing protein n=1 Tax=Fusarium pseudograminearum (strain CS3096) TaxID=1028729 RepID=K3VFY8_FUSPC|nr:hypothetical protein FPSE_06990 [Fusarium pseudograminearum CS3096]EKJ72944.1 hypothetical protein FPSE_06990 [Fusarium pseudograminearum CS3096]
MSLAWFRCRARLLALVAVFLFGTFFCLTQYADMGSLRQGSLLALLSSTPTLIGSDPKLKWYPPSENKVNSLKGAIDGEGTYGFIFDSSVTPDEKYGTYNWCNMPHARKREYKKPEKEYELQYVEVIQRHHKRTPYAANAFPVESYQWNCDNQGLYYFGRQFTDEPKPNAQGYWKGFISDINPFIPSGWIGSCQFPQITAEGLDDSWVHGKDLYEVYHDLLKFIPGRNEDWRSKVKFRVTNNQITSQVAGMFINGMYQATDSVPLHIQQAGVDSLEPQYKCSVGSKLSSAIKSSSNAEWKKHLDKTKSLYKVLDDISGVPADDEGFHESFDHYYDNLSARQCHAKPFPCKLVDGKNSTKLGQWEYSQIYRDAPASLAASATSWGVWIAELASHFRQVMSGKQDILYLHNFAHDGSVSRLLSILQIDVMVWPGMGSEVVFELYKKGGKYFVRVLFSGKTLKSSHPDLGVMEMVPVERLLDYFDGLAAAWKTLFVYAFESCLSCWLASHFVLLALLQGGAQSRHQRRTTTHQPPTGAYRRTVTTQNKNASSFQRLLFHLFHHQLTPEIQLRRQPGRYGLKLQFKLELLPAMRAHVANSYKHHVCTHCDHGPDYETADDLNHHLEEDHNACLECNEMFYDEEDLIQHDVDVHNRCPTCQRFFDSPSNLMNHEKVHMEKNMKCLACPRMFISNSAMMLHLEHGTCESGANLRVIQNVVADWYEEYGPAGHDHEDDFRCENCGSYFNRLSALLQHAESETCDAAVWDFYRIFVHIEYNQDAFQLFDY